MREQIPSTISDSDLLARFAELLAESFNAIRDPVLRDRMKLRFGVEDGRARTLAEVGVIAGVTRERIRQNEAKFWRLFRSAAKRYGTPQFRFATQFGTRSVWIPARMSSTSSLRK